MKIGIVNYAYPAHRQTPEAALAGMPSLTGWAAALRAAGAHRVTVLQRFERPGEMAQGDITYQFIADTGGPLPAGRRIPQRLHAALIATQPDLVHVNGQIFPVQTLALRRSLPQSTAIVIQHHAGDPLPIRGLKGRLRRVVDRLGLRCADGWFFTSAAMAAPWRAAGLISPHAIVRPVLEASTSLRAPIGPIQALPGCPALLWVGRLHPQKDPLTVLEGLARLRTVVPNAVLSMVGVGELCDAVRARAAQADLAGHVVLRGTLPHAALPEFYAAADAFVLGSHHEGSGYALIEALACGAPPVVTDIAPFRAIVGDDLGALWAPGDAPACATALHNVISGDRAAQRRAAQVRFATALSWERIGVCASAAYNDVIRARRARCGLH